jgi:hypothetical protein
VVAEALVVPKVEDMLRVLVVPVDYMEAALVVICPVTVELMYLDNQQLG